MLLLLLTSSAVAQMPSKESKVRYRDSNGREEVVTGVIRKETVAEVIVKPASGAERTIPSTDIVEVEYPSPSFALSKEMRAARTQEQAGKLDAALKMYQELAGKLPDSLLRRQTEFTIAQVTARLADSDAAQIKPAVERLSGYLRKYPDSW